VRDVVELADGRFGHGDDDGMLVLSVMWQVWEGTRICMSHYGGQA
jgi:hypothetical protein